MQNEDGLNIHGFDSNFEATTATEGIEDGVLGSDVTDITTTVMTSTKGAHPISADNYNPGFEQSDDLVGLGLGQGNIEHTLPDNTGLIGQRDGGAPESGDLNAMIPVNDDMTMIDPVLAGGSTS